MTDHAYTSAVDRGQDRRWWTADESGNLDPRPSGYLTLAGVVARGRPQLIRFDAAGAPAERISLAEGIARLSTWAPAPARPVAEAAAPPSASRVEPPTRVTLYVEPEGSPIRRLPPRFINWRAVPNGDKIDKVPTSPRTGHDCNPTDPAHWTHYDAAISAAQATGCGVGWVLNGDGFAFLDFDKCNVGGAWSPAVLAIIAPFQAAGAAMEVSQSGTGLHVIGRYDPSRLDASRHRNKVDGWREFYVTGRFVAFGPHGWQGNPNADCTDALLSPGVLELRPEPAAPSLAGTCPVPDDDVLRRLLAAQGMNAAFGGKATPAQLWQADPATLGRFFPSPSGAPFDHSSADAALLAHLAFWTHRDPATMARLFERSGLMRSKWAERPDYRAASIDGAIAGCARVADWTPRPTVQPPVASTGAPGIDVPRAGYLTIPDQLTHFAGCVYIRSLNRILTPTGELLDNAQFRATFGGYEFAMQADGARPTKSAWEAFTENRAHGFPKARAVTLRPDLPFGTIVGDEANGYLRCGVEPVEGDVTPFLSHLEYLIPDANDRAMLVKWLARVVQQPGKLTRWAPALIGPFGNGKSFVFNCVQAAIGDQFTHKVNPKEITATHNGWIHGKLFARVEEIKMGERRDIFEDMKTWITDPTINVRAMNTDSVTITNVLNFGFATNHADGVVKLRGDRRVAIFETNETVQSDSYYVRLFNWAETGGYAAVAWYLLHRVDTVDLPIRAPHTSGTDEAIANTLGRAEQFLQEAIDEGRQGFRAGWLSAWAARQVLEDAGIKAVAPRKLGQIIENLGYRRSHQAPRAIVQEAMKKPIIYASSDRMPDFERYVGDQGYSDAPIIRLVP